MKINNIIAITLVAILLSWITLMHYKIVFINDYLVVLTNQSSFIQWQHNRVVEKLDVVKPYLDLIKTKHKIKEDTAKKAMIQKNLDRNQNKVWRILTEINK